MISDANWGSGRARRQARRTFGLVLVTSFSVLVPLIHSSAHAALLAYDPFQYGDVAIPALGQYAVGSENSGVKVLGGQNPTIGPTAFYGGPWIQSGGDSQVVKAVPSLYHPSLTDGIGGIQGESVQFECCSFGRSGRPIAGGLGGGAARTVYESFLIDFGTQGTDDPANFGKRGHELWNGGIGDAFQAVDLFLNHFSGVNELSLAVTTASGSMQVPVAGGGLGLEELAATYDGVHLVVMKYEFNPIAPDVVSVFLDPAMGIEPGTPDAQIVVPTSDLFITHHGAFTNFTFSGPGHVPGAIDEIRWGGTYADVTPARVPEPGSWALLGLGLSGGLAWRRRI
ncbi:PEP-CTERM sorting domain-containing protein [Aeoliella sp. SH292]|uniref:PEP-CTERM sorting domain-containing protein n=1 Tax=Aeoliella sp. SH292 TaxID=3454464 RepID=UPI003F96FB1C